MTTSSNRKSSNSNINNSNQLEKYKIDKYKNLSKMEKIKKLKENTRKCQLINLPSAIEKLNLGHLVSFPTETVYGLGCDISFRSAIQSIYKTKSRPYSDPLIVHISSFEYV
jgi:tRNA A37 threonylcarbamoyladenosine synthetase subunit TsaC/SUA5/YrdC